MHLDVVEFLITLVPHERCSPERSRVVDTAAAAVPEVQLSWVTPCSASETLSVGHRGRSVISSFGDARLWSHRWMQIYIPWIPIFIITTDPHRGSRRWVASFPTLSISDAERRVYHNRSVSDALHHHRISDTMMNSIHPLIPRTSALTARYCSRVVDTAVVQADERRVVRSTKKVAPRRDPTTEWCFLRCIMLKMSRVESRLAATYQAIVFRFAKSPT